MAAEQILKHRWKKTAEHDGHYRTKARTRGNADDARVGQRIAKQALKYSAGDGKCRSNKHTEKQSRKPDVEENDAVHLRKVPSGEKIRQDGPK